MKYLILVGDGMADHPLPELQGKTPLEVAQTPGLDAMARRGVLGLFCPIPDGLPAGSEIGNLSLFGYNPRSVFTGRAPLEAANQGIQLGPKDLAFRCNLVTLKDGLMHDFTSGHISSAEGAEIVATLNETLGQDFPIRFSPGVGYRHLAILTADAHPSLEDYINTACTPPHNIMDQPYAPHLPQGGAQSVVRDLMQRSEAVLRAHPTNRARLDRGELAATSIWLWGQGTAPAMEPYSRLYNRSGAVVSAVDLVNGIGRIAGFEVLDVPGMTGWIDTNYGGKVSAALDALD
ncbi:MAG: phosphoglycerate mutase, partial [Candidatus Hydrogenedentes bacterium]|nr:phosphoglycerate mutase [Candidatus Hydrogenedentota bacterium]